MVETETTLLVKKGNDSGGDTASAHQMPTSVEEPKFSSKWGILLTSVGCAVGTGNVWRFPRIVANNSGQKGGLQFLLVWIPFLFLWSMPLIILEYAIGRFTRRAAPMTFYKLLGVKSTWMGCWINAINFLFACYYSVLEGYTVFYLFHCIFYPLPTTLEESQDIWKGFVDESSFPVVTHFVITVACAIVIWRGVASIERVMTFMIPGLLLLILAAFIWTLTLKGAWLGVVFLFTPDWDMMKRPRLWIDALSQNAVDTSAGWGQFLVLGTSMAANQGPVQTGIIVPATNNAISLMCAAMICATVFSMYNKLNPGETPGGAAKLLKENGPANTGLTFIWLPILFSHMTGGRVIASLFFLALAMAGFSSYVIMLDTAVQPLVDLGLKREVSVVLLSLLAFLLGIPSALSPKVLANQDFVWGAAFIFSGLMFVYLFWRYGAADIRVNLMNQAGLGTDWKVPKAYEWLVKYILPVEGTVVTVWWVVDTVRKDTVPWYDIGIDTLMTAFLEWGCLLLLLIVFNVLLCVFQPQISRWWQNLVIAIQDSLCRCCKRRQEDAKDSDDVCMKEIAEQSSPSSHAKDNGYDSFQN